jgi:hypothetical protein
MNSSQCLRIEKSTNRERISTPSQKTPFPREGDKTIEQQPMLAIHPLECSLRHLRLHPPAAPPPAGIAQIFLRPMLSGLPRSDTRGSAARSSEGLSIAAEVDETVYYQNSPILSFQKLSAEKRLCPGENHNILWFGLLRTGVKHP